MNDTDIRSEELGPVPGDGGTGGFSGDVMAQIADEIREGPTELSGDSSPAACSALTKAGRPCGKTRGIRSTDLGPRCGKHLPRVAVRAPVRALRTPDDAVRLSSWAAIEAAEGRIAPSAANAVANACREFRRSFEASDYGETTKAAIALADLFHAAIMNPDLDVESIRATFMPNSSPLYRALLRYIGVRSGVAE